MALSLKLVVLLNVAAEENVETPVTFNCCDVRFVVLVTPKVETPETTRVLVLTSAVVIPLH